MKDERLYLVDILESIKNIESFISTGKTAFLDSLEKQLAITRSLEIIGEASKKVSDRLKENYPDVAWSKAARTRDVLIHDYGKVDPIEIWEISIKDLPILKGQIEAILKELGDPR